MGKIKLYQLIKNDPTGVRDFPDNFIALCDDMLADNTVPKDVSAKVARLRAYIDVNFRKKKTIK